MKFLMNLLTPNIQELSDRQDVKGLIRALRHRDKDIRTKAAIALGKLRDAQAVKPLLAALEDADEDVNHNAATALLHLDNPDGLIPILRHRNRDLRKMAAKALGELKDCQAVNPLLDALKDTDEDVRLSAATSLMVLGDHRGAEFLLAAVANKSSFRKTMSYLSQYRFTDPDFIRLPSGIKTKLLIVQLENSNESIRRDASNALDGILPNEEISRLAHAGQIKAKVEELLRESSREYAMKDLIDLKDAAAVEPLIGILEDTSINRWPRSRAATILGELGDLRALEPLVFAHKNDDWGDVRTAATAALSKLPDMRAIETIMDSLAHDSIASVREEAARSLAKHNDDKVVDSLIRALKDDAIAVRRGAAWALAELGGHKAVEALVGTYMDPAQLDEIRNLVEGLLDNIGKDSLEKPLSQLGSVLQNGDPKAKWFAIRLLQYVGAPIAVVVPFLQSPDPNVRTCAANALMGGDNLAVPYLIAALKDDFPEVRKAAAESLGKIAGVRALESLTSVMKDESPEVRIAALYSIYGFYGGTGTSAENLLAFSLNDLSADVKQVAKDLLRSISERRRIISDLKQSDFSRVRSYQRSGNWMTRGEAASQVADLQSPETLKLLTDMLKGEGYWPVRQSIIRGIGFLAVNLAIPEAEDILISALEKEDSDIVSRDIIRYLGRIGSEKTERILLEYYSRSKKS
jgi:HEAT repeat protein